MRTNIEIDDAVLKAAMEAGAFTTKKEAVEAGLRLLARRKAYEGLRAMRGKVAWDPPETPISITAPATQRRTNKKAKSTSRRGES